MLAGPGMSSTGTDACDEMEACRISAVYLRTYLGWECYNLELALALRRFAVCSVPFVAPWRVGRLEVEDLIMPMADKNEPPMGPSAPNNAAVSGAPLKAPGEKTPSGNNLSVSLTKSGKRQKLDLAERNSSCRFLLIKRDEGNFDTVSPFTISKTIHAQCGKVAAVRKVKDGLIVEVFNANQVTSMMNMKALCDIPVTVVKHSTLNYSKGVVTCRDLLNCSLEEIKSELAAQGVVDVRRITTRRDGNVINTTSLVLTFDSPKLPTRIQAAMYSLNVRAYIPNPLRCFRCQQFGHTALKCNRPHICACGKTSHEGTPCTGPVKCVNCNGNHSARSRDCPKFKEEMAFMEYMTINKCSFGEARKQVLKSAVRDTGSYAAATAKSPKPGASIEDILKVLVPELRKIVTDVVSESQKSIRVERAAPVDAQGQDSPPSHQPESFTRLVKDSNMLPPASNTASRPAPHPSPSDVSGDPSNSAIQSEAESVDMDELSDFRSTKKRRGWPKGKPRL